MYAVNSSVVYSYSIKGIYVCISTPFSIVPLSLTSPWRWQPPPCPAETQGMVVVVAVMCDPVQVLKVHF